MVGAVKSWIGDTYNIYLRNATSQRDFRVQLRGNRSIILFSLYLIVLILVAMNVYGDAAAYSTIVDAQRGLRSFYSAVMYLLSGSVALIAPAMASMTIVIEKQRRSLDLVFSAPVTSRYYLVGKLLGVYRYIWLLLVLALPVTAACVMLGGATWTSVLESYLNISMAGLVLSAIGILNSCYATKPIPSLLWSYAFAVGYLLVVTAAGGSAVGYRSAAMMGAGGKFDEVNFFLTLSPFMTAELEGTYTTIYNVAVPNWITSSLVAILISRLIIAGAGSLIAPAGTKEIRSLRINSLLYLVAFAGISVYFAAPSLVILGKSSGIPSGYPGYLAAMLVGIPLLLLIWFITPTISAYGFDDLRRLRPNGIFNIREAFKGTPSGALPFLVLILTTVSLAILLGLYCMGGSLAEFKTLPAYLVLVFGSGLLTWSIARYGSATLRGVKVGRSYAAIWTIMLVAAPPAIFAAFASESFSKRNWTVWNFYPYKSLTGDPKDFWLAIIHGACMIVAAFIIAWIAEQRLQTNLLRIEQANASK